MKSKKILILSDGSTLFCTTKKFSAIKTKKKFSCRDLTSLKMEGLNFSSPLNNSTLKNKNYKQKYTRPFWGVAKR